MSKKRTDISKANSYYWWKLKKQRFNTSLNKLKSLGLNPIVLSEKNQHLQVGKFGYWTWTGKIHVFKDSLLSKGSKGFSNQRGLNNFIKLIEQDT